MEDWDCHVVQVSLGLGLQADQVSAGMGLQADQVSMGLRMQKV